MISYSRIIKEAYSLTANHKILWLFGLFVAGSSNIAFFGYQNKPLPAFAQLRVQELVLFLVDHPQVLFTLSLTVLIFSLLSLVATNWSRIMLVLVVESIIKTKFSQTAEQMKKSTASLFPVIQISLFTTALVMVVAVGLFVPAWFVRSNLELQTFFLIFAAVVFLPLAFAISCINIFTSFFVVVLKQNLSRALTLGTDFFVVHWPEILGLVVILMVIYSVCFFVGISVIYLLHALFAFIFGEKIRFPTASLSAMMLIPNVLSGFLIWALIAVLNVFFNTALLLLFFQLVTPIESKNEYIHAMPAAPVAPL